MKISNFLYCILTSGRIRETPYGEERFALRLGRWLIEHNSDVVIIGSTLTGVKEEFLSKEETDKIKESPKKKIRVLNPPYVVYALSRLCFSLLYIIKIYSINKKSPIKVIHAQDTGYSGFPAVIAGKIMKIPVVLSSHGIRHKTLEPILTGRLGKIWIKFEYDIDVFTVRNADGIIAINPEVKNYYEKLLGKKIEFIPNPVRIKDFAFSLSDRNVIRKEIGIDDQMILIGYVGRLSPEKNLITLLKSFSKAIRHNPFIRLVIVGTGPQESDLRNEVRKQHIEDKVIFCGLRNDIAKILSGLDIFVLPSYSEGLSSALLEAMCCERAIICSNISGNKVLITHEREGLLFNPYDSNELERAIQILSSDDSLRSVLGHNAKRKTIEYDEDIVFQKIVHYYSILNKEKAHL